jgi:hypothetical protein
VNDYQDPAVVTASRYQRSQGVFEGRELGWILLFTDDPLRQLEAAIDPATSTEREARWARVLVVHLRRAERFRATVTASLGLAEALADVERRG